MTLTAFLKGLMPPATALAAALMLSQPIMVAEEPRQRVMGLFYLSILLTLLLAYLMGAIGRAFGLAFSDSKSDLAGRLQAFGFPVLHRHAWGDFGRLYALLFLVMTGPALLVALVGSVSAGFFSFDADLIMETYDGEPLWVLSEGALMAGVVAGEIPVPRDVQQVAQWIDAVNRGVAILAYLVLLVFLMRLVPFFYWRSGGAAAPTLAQTWAGVGWRRPLTYGAGLTLALIFLFWLPVPQAILAVAFVLILTSLLCLYARGVGPYAGDI